MSLTLPLWLQFSESHIRQALGGMKVPDFGLAPLNIPQRWPKPKAVDHVYLVFMKARQELLPGLSEIAIKEFFVMRLGETVMQRLVHPPCPPQEEGPLPKGFFFHVPGRSPLITKKSIAECLSSLHPSRHVPLSRGFAGLVKDLYDSVIQRTRMLEKLTFEGVLSHIRCFRPAQEYHAGMIDQIVRVDRPPAPPTPRQATLEEEKQWWKDQDASWPRSPNIMRCIGLMKSYHDASKIKYGLVCSVCSRRKLDRELTVKAVKIFSDEEHQLFEALGLLTCMDARFDDDFLFEAPWDRLSGLMLDRHGMAVDEDSTPLLNFCAKCESYLNKGKMPPHAWANGLYRGKLPARFNDMTWVEEKACAPANTTAHVVRMYNSTREDAPKVFYGNVCAHDTNVVDFASVLPRTPQDINDCITVVFIGPERFKAECIKKLFYVRKPLLLDFLRHMKFVTKHPDYVNIDISEENLSMYPDSDGLPGSLEKVMHDPETDPSAFQSETAGPDAHPAEGIRNESEGEPIIFMEKIGIADSDALMGSADVSTAYGLRNLYAKKGLTPDLVLQRGRDAIPEYHNPTLFPSLYPTLFPYGTGGFEDGNRVTPISFQEQANLLLDTVDRSCRYHHSFLFVVCNILQRRAGHLGTYLTVGEDRFEEVAKRLVKLDEKVVLSIADRMEKGIKLENLNAQEGAVMELLKEVRTVAARVPGSFAGKLRARTEIRNYMAFFNLPIFFFTANPNAVHSPLFQVMYGDETINLDERFPAVAAYNERARRVAHDPVAAADFFGVSFKLLLETLLGWDFELGRSKKEGGLLGHVSAWYEMSELTGRGGIHGHTVVCMRGSLNPSEIHARLRQDSAFEKRICEYFDSVQWHALPDVSERAIVEHDVRCERFTPPPVVPAEIPMGNLTFNDCFEHPNAFCARLEVAGFGELARWWMEFLSDAKTVGEKLQRHTCRDVCFKYGHETCRFQFPHEIVTESHFDAETNSLRLRVLDALVNWFNIFLLVAARHNHDLRTMSSGTSCLAATYYITDYITKLEEKTHYIISLFSKAVHATKTAAGATSNSTVAGSAKTLLQKCLAQLTSRQQIHAQQAAWYVRGHGDVWSSHQTVPMLSASLIRFVKITYGDDPVSTDSQDPEEDEDSQEAPACSDSQDTQIRLVVDPDQSEVQTSHQLQNYYHRDLALKDVCFYDFVHRFRVEKKGAPTQTAAAYRRFALLSPHRQSITHEIVEHTNYETQVNPTLKVPVVYGCSIPRSNGDQKRYAMFVLAHFKPFSPQSPLIRMGETWESVLQSFTLCEMGQRIVKNWDALYECEDEREKERQRKRNNRLRSTEALRGVIYEQADLLIVDEMATGKQANFSPLASFLTGGTGSLLCSGGWISRRVGQYQFGRSDEMSMQLAGCSEGKRWNVTNAQVTWWIKALKEQEKAFLNGELPPPVLEREQGKVYDTPNLIEAQSPDCARASLPEASETPLSETAAEVISRIGQEAKLNPEQYRVYEIAANAYIALLEERRLGIESGDKRLSMFVNGPGGTGKTYAIQTFQKLMTEFRCGHRIKYTAPSGAAASLIQGVTLHSSLKIRVFKGKEKHGQYAITLTSQQKLELQNQFLNIDVLVVDEVSMVSAALMAQIDASTRIAKNNDQPFGGMITIFSGDFYQFPPVAAISLYETFDDIDKKKGSSEFKLQSKLGRMAWRTVNTVIELHRQERMKDDAVFAGVVLRLRKAMITEQDVSLLNTRVIRSHLNPAGIRLDADDDLKTATVVVKKNEDRLLANYCKAIETQPDLVMCAARDYIDDQPVESALLRSYLLKLDMTKDIGKGALPSYVPLYRGMPVIMRRHNQAACLGVANGAQGFLRDFEVGVDALGYTYLKSSIVEFPKSQVKLPGLPPKHVALPTWRYSFQTVIPAGLVPSDQPKLVTVSRHLTDFEPAFAITAHCAQGKTLDKVVGYIKKGGPAAYVTISRARRLKDLILLSPVSRASLNEELNASLQLEATRLDALHNNTLIRYGYKQGSLVDVVDPDCEKSAVEGAVEIRYTWEKEKRGKRKREDNLPVEMDEQMQSPNASKNKDGRVGAAKRSRVTNEIVESTVGGPSTPLGCRWDRTNWSCAYDCLMTMVDGIVRGFDEQFIHRLASTGDRMDALLQIFAEARPTSQSSLEDVRQRCRMLFNSWDGVAFPLYGNALASIERMMFILTGQATLTMELCLRSTCDACNDERVIGSTNSRWPIIVSPQLVHLDFPVAFDTIQGWIDIMTSDRDIEMLQPPLGIGTCNCSSSTTLSLVTKDSPPFTLFIIWLET